MAWRKKPDDVRMDEALARDEAAKTEVDPALVSRLEAWFGPLGPPESEQTEIPDWLPPGWAPPPRDDSKQEWRRARAIEAAEAGELLGRLEAQGARYGSMIEPTEPLEVAIDPGIARFDLARWGVRTAAGERELEVDEELREAMKHRTPQSILRDLHRPVIKVRQVALEERRLGSRAGAEELAELREVLRSRYRAEFEGVADASRQMHAATREMRARYAEPWEDARPAEPAPFPSDAPDPELMKWFFQGEDDE